MHRRYSSLLLCASLGPQRSHLWAATTHSDPGSMGKWKELSKVTDSRTETVPGWSAPPQPHPALLPHLCWGASLSPKQLSARNSSACWKTPSLQGLGKEESCLTQLPQPRRHHPLSSPLGMISFYPLGLGLQILWPCSPWASHHTPEHGTSCLHFLAWPSPRACLGPLCLPERGSLCLSSSHSPSLSPGTPSDL